METIKRLLVVDRSRAPGVAAGAVYLCKWRIGKPGDAWVWLDVDGEYYDDTCAYPCGGVFREPRWCIMYPDMAITNILHGSRDISEPVMEVVAETKPRLVLRHNWNEETQ